MSGILVENIHLWRGHRQILDGVGFSAQAGSLVHVSGANGSGKTTLLRTVCGLSLPEEGEIAWRSRSTREFAQEFRSQIAFLGHRDSISDELNTRENLRYGLAMMGSRADHAAIELVLKQLHMDRHAHLPARVLSAGQRRRAALARVFLSAARLWLLDEPYTHLDGQGRDTLNEKIVQQLAGGGIVILTTHDVTLLPRPADHEVAI